MADFSDGLEIKYTRHAILRMQRRQIFADEVSRAIRTGVLIEDYPEEQPLPLRLNLAFTNERPIHALFGYDDQARLALVITAYSPTLDKWLPGFKERRPK